MLYRQTAKKVSIYHKQRANNQSEEPQILKTKEEFVADDFYDDLDA